MFLEQIISQTRVDLEQRKCVLPLEELQRLALAQAATRDLLVALRPRSKARISLIAEVKRASPSKGVFAPHIDPVELACTYAAHGATPLDGR